MKVYAIESYAYGHSTISARLFLKKGKAEQVAREERRRELGYYERNPMMYTPTGARARELPSFTVIEIEVEE